MELAGLLIIVIVSMGVMFHAFGKLEEVKKNKEDSHE